MKMHTLLILFCVLLSNPLAAQPTTLDYVLAGGFGGNEKIGKFVYDDGKLPLHFTALKLMRDAQKEICFLTNNNVTVRVINFATDNPIVEFPCPAVDPYYQLYWDASIEAVNGAYSPANDAMYAGEMTNAMYQHWYHTTALQQMPITLRVHDWGGATASWNGETVDFGDGDDHQFYPFVSLGIAAHEISHGFTQQHSHLQYYGQSGGLNESFSDMASKAVEFYATGTNQDWELGAEIMRSDRAYRYMDNPRRDCIALSGNQICSIDNLKDYSTKLDVHYSSGIFNKAFYLLATATGWNTRKAFDVMEQANLAYWTETTNFTEAACGVLEATKDYGYDLATVSHAFAQVGIATDRC